MNEASFGELNPKRLKFSGEGGDVSAQWARLSFLKKGALPKFVLTKVSIDTILHEKTFT